MSDATPGPWRVGNLESYDGYTGKPYRNVWAGEPGEVVARAMESGDVDANARLIAAAPELRDALGKMLAVFGGLERLLSAPAMNKNPGKEAIEAARAALALATPPHDGRPAP